MKTSNKLLCVGAGMFFLMNVSVLFYTKSNMIVKRVDEGAKGNGVMVTTNLRSSYQTETLKLDANYVYTLDPNSTAVTVTMDENLSNNVKCSHNGPLGFYREGNINFSPSQPLQVSIGVKGKNRLKIEVGDQAQLKNIGLLKTDLSIEAENQARVDLDIESETLSLNVENQASVFLKGKAPRLKIELENQAKADVKDLQVDSIHVELSDQASFKAQHARHLNLDIEDVARADFDTKWDQGDITINDNASVRVAGKKYNSRDEEE